MTKAWVPYTMDMLLAIWQILGMPENIFGEKSLLPIFPPL
jgi:hypothetical protein